MSNESYGDGGGGHLKVCNARVPGSLLEGRFELVSEGGCVLVDIELRNGLIRTVGPAGAVAPLACRTLDAAGGVVLPGYVDVHTHLDKTHTLQRVPNPDGTLRGAIQAEREDMSRHWSLQDVIGRMHFGVACAWAHGTSAMRTHLLSDQPWREMIWEAFAEVQQLWLGKMRLQPAALVDFDLLRDTVELERLADWVLMHRGVLGCAIMGLAGSDLATHLDRLLRVAAERELDLDFHVDENANPASRGLAEIAASVQRTRYEGRVVVGHCCSLALQSPEVVRETLIQVRESQIAVVALPLTNAFLQGRTSGTTPSIRGITRLREMHEMGVLTALASDNCRDPFHPFGDYDMREVLASGVLMAHLDQELPQAFAAVTRNPAQMMRLDGVGVIAEGAIADLVIYREQSLDAFVARRSPPAHLVRNGVENFPVLPEFGMLPSPTKGAAGR
ncbi:MAG: cytosine deaminase [Haliea sp.]|uniref:cytosine deaminase n=1 Tax=Haliea sp. TaxID=1932666 RepID=UPI0032EECF8A